MKEIILKVLSEVACGNTGTCQINLQSESARNMIAERIEVALRPHVGQIIEDIVTPSKHSPMSDNEFYLRKDDSREV
tara:strand:+ start:79 stop:309 length:231 start_codon:yes stop_codon:yes gene_type:complete